MASVSGFLTKTFGIFSDPHNEDICGWGPAGDTIQVRKIDEFSKNILPQYFKHSNFQSFVRQLNMYDFHKTIQDPGNGEFQHPYFLKDRPDLLHLIKRKAHSRTEGKSKALHGMGSTSSHHESSSSSSSTNQSTDFAPQSEPIHFVDSKPRNPRGDIEQSHGRRPHHHDDHTHRIQELEAQQAALVSENMMLKKFVSEMKYKQEELTNKTDGLLRVLYHMFFSSGLNLPKGALSGIPESRLKEFYKFLQIDAPIPLVKRGSLDESHLISNHAFGSSSMPILHMDTPMLDDFMHLDSVDTEEIHPSSSSEPLRKLFSFDTVANSVSQPTDSSLVIRSNSLERLAKIDMPPPRIENIPASGEVTQRRTSIAIPEGQEGAALTRNATIDSSIFKTYEAEGKESIKDGSKKRKFGNDSSTEDSQILNANSSNGAALVRQDAIDTQATSEEQSDEIPMRRLDSMDSVLASFLSFEQDPTSSPPPDPSSRSSSSS